MRVAERLQRAQLSSKVVTSEVVRRSARNVEPGQHLQALQDRMTDKSHGVALPHEKCYRIGSLPHLKCYR